MPKLPPARFFPDAELADSDGLLALGGKLSPEWLLDAYQHGIFPWPLRADAPVAWWSPHPRAILEPDALYVSRRLRRTLKSRRFRVTCDRDFPAVIHGCATAGDRNGQTWITPAMIEAYTRLFELGHAHSVEAWQDDRVVGGVYGVAIGGLFAAESKFYTLRDASKVALVHLVYHLKARNYTLFDIQQLTPHMERMGATEIPRKTYLSRLAEVWDRPVTFGRDLQWDPSEL